MSIRNAFVFSVSSVFAGFVAVSDAQVPYQQASPMLPMPSAVPSYGAAAYQPPEWDYRFDAQYNSTIKPYLRWYRRLANANNQQQYPYYFGPGAMNQGQMPNWFNPYRFMNASNYDQFMSRPQRGPAWRRSSGSGSDVAPPPPPADIRRYLDQTSTKTRRAWIAYDAESDTTSVLYQKPTQHLDRFYEADVVVKNGARITSIEWIRQPDWSDRRPIVAR